MPTVGTIDLWRSAQVSADYFAGRGGRKSAADKFHRARISASEVEWFLKFGNRRYPIPRELAIRMIFALERAFMEFKVPNAVAMPMLNYINRWSAYKRSVWMSPIYYRVLNQILRTGEYDSQRLTKRERAAKIERGFA